MGKSAFGTIVLMKKSADMVAIGELTDIGGPSISVDEVDVTHHQSADAYREFVAGVIDAGELSLEGNLTQSNAELIKTAIDNRAVIDFSVQFPKHLDTTWKATVWDFGAVPTAWEQSAPFEDKLSFSGTVKITGKPDLTEEDLYTVTLEEFNDESGVEIKLYTDSTRNYQYGQTVHTDSNGEVDVYLLDGTYYYTATKTGFIDEDGDFVVDGLDLTETFTLSI